MGAEYNVSESMNIVSRIAYYMGAEYNVSERIMHIIWVLNFQHPYNMLSDTLYSAFITQPKYSIGQLSALHQRNDGGPLYMLTGISC